MRKHTKVEGTNSKPRTAYADAKKEGQDWPSYVTDPFESLSPINRKGRLTTSEKTGIAEIHERGAKQTARGSRTWPIRVSAEAVQLAGGGDHVVPRAGLRRCRRLKRAEPCPSSHGAAVWGRVVYVNVIQHCSIWPDSRVIRPPPKEPQPASEDRGGAVLPPVRPRTADGGGQLDPSVAGRVEGEEAVDVACRGQIGWGAFSTAQLETKIWPEQRWGGNYEKRGHNRAFMQI